MSLTRFDSSSPDKLVVRTEAGEEKERGLDYLFDEALETAVNVALAINRPLLITGEPGSGKTELGYAIARKLPEVHHVFLFTVKSTSEARDLFYQFDVLGRFHAAQVRSVTSADSITSSSVTRSAEGAIGNIDPLLFLRYRALGRAILMSYGRAAVEHLLPATEDIPKMPTRSVVIIDEVDKAPPDFANDLLFELDQFRFEVPEISIAREMMATPAEKPSPSHMPIVIVTANSDKLPPAFMRRCVFHDIQIDPVRDEERFKSIVISRLGRNLVPDNVASAAMRLALNAFKRARELNIEPRVSLAELLDAAFVACEEFGKIAPTFTVSARLKEGIAKSMVKSKLGQDELLAERNDDLWRVE